MTFIFSNQIRTIHDIIIVFILIVGLFIIMFAGNETVKELNRWQMIGLMILHASIVFLAVILIDFMVRPLSEGISIGWLQWIVKIGLYIITLFFVYRVLYSVSRKISDEKFP